MADFSCTQCGKCCSNLGADRKVLLLDEDISRISRMLEMEESAFIENFAVLSRDFSEAAGRDVYELRHRDGVCLFLNENTLCTIHAFKPYQCKHGPESFLPGSMTRDYECMRAVDVIDTPEIEDYFFRKLIGEL